MRDTVSLPSSFFTASGGMLREYTNTLSLCSAIHTSMSSWTHQHKQLSILKQKPHMSIMYVIMSIILVQPFNFVRDFLNIIISGIEDCLCTQWPLCSADVLTDALDVCARNCLVLGRSLWQPSHLVCYFTTARLGIDICISIFWVTLHHQSMPPFICQGTQSHLLANLFSFVVEAVQRMPQASRFCVYTKC